jgi:hypothetical protein
MAASLCGDWTVTFCGEHNMDARASNDSPDKPASMAEIVAINIAWLCGLSGFTAGLVTQNTGLALLGLADEDRSKQCLLGLEVVRRPPVWEGVAKRFYPEIRSAVSLAHFFHQPSRPL